MLESEYLKCCPDDQWSEFVDGKIVIHDPPTTEHALLSSFLFHLMSLFAEDAEWKVLRGSYQVRLAKNRRSPDIMLIRPSRSQILLPDYVNGAPDLIFEIVPPDSQSRDRREKFLEYQRAGLGEYWIVDPLSKTVEAYRLARDGKFSLILEKDGRIRSTVLPKFYLKPDWLWREKLPKVSALLREINSAKR